MTATHGMSPKCGRVFYDGWERGQHGIGRHHYRSWTADDGARQAEGVLRALGMTPPPERADLRWLDRDEDDDR